MRGALAVTVLALGLTAAMAAPVLVAPTERVIGHEIVGRHHDAYTMMRLFERPRSGGLAEQPVTDRSAALIARSQGGVAAYNAIVLLSFPLAALFAFLLARHFSLPGWAAAVAALAFAFAPSHLAHAAYHPHIVQVQWIPLYLLTLVRCLERWTPGRALALVGAGFLLALSCFYFGLFGALLTPVVLLVYRPAPLAGSRPEWGRTTLALVGAGLAGLAYLSLRMDSYAALAQRYGFPRVDLDRYSAHWYSYLLPPVEHPLVGDRLASFWRSRGVADGLVEQQLTLGLGLLVLAGVAVLAWRRQRGRIVGGQGVPLFLALALTAVVASLQPSSAGGPWPAPALPEMVHSVLPTFRAFARLGIFAQLMVALLAAVGAAALARRGPRGRLALVLLLALTAIELTPFPPWRWHHVLPTEGHRWLAGRPAPWRLLDCAPMPLRVAASVSQFLPQRGAALPERISDGAEPGLAGRLSALGYSHLLLRTDSPEDRWWTAAGLGDGLEAAAEFADSRVLRIAAPPAAVYVDLWQGFSWREYGEVGSFRWLGPSGGWWLVNGTSGEQLGWLELELWALEPRDLDLELDGAGLGRLRIDTTPRRFRVGPLVLAPGRRRLDWRPRGSPTVPDRILANGDRRPLTVAVGGWSWQPEPAAGEPPEGGG